MNDARNSVGTIVTLTTGIAICVLVIILVSALGGSTYSLVDEDIDNISTLSLSETNYYNETFQPPDKNGTNPTESWYTYSESGLPYMNVTNETTGPLPGGTNQTYHMNTDGNATTGGCMYNFTNETTYEQLTLFVMVDSSEHNYTIITIGSWISGYEVNGHGAIAYWNVTNDTIYFYVLTGTGPTYTEVYNHSITTGTWYRLRATFDYTTHAIGSNLNSVGIAGALTQLSTGSQTCAYSYTNLTRSFWAMTAGAGEANNSIWMDDFQLLDRVYTEDSTQLTIETAIKDGVIGGFRGLSTTGSYLPIIVLALVITIALGLLLTSVGKVGSDKIQTGGKGGSGAL
jgi:hypothetical protein